YTRATAVVIATRCPFCDPQIASARAGNGRARNYDTTGTDGAHVVAKPMPRRPLAQVTAKLPRKAIGSFRRAACDSGVRCHVTAEGAKCAQPSLRGAARTSPPPVLLVGQGEASPRVGP